MHTLLSENHNLVVQGLGIDGIYHARPEIIKSHR
jgi:hypothetical protein